MPLVFPAESSHSQEGSLDPAKQNAKCGRQEVSWWSFADRGVSGLCEGNFVEITKHHIIAFRLGNQT
jgi:hypothetical protein